jgi:hypothetical protein
MAVSVNIIKDGLLQYKCVSTNLSVQYEGRRRREGNNDMKGNEGTVGKQEITAPAVARPYTKNIINTSEHMIRREEGTDTASRNVRSRLICTGIGGVLMDCDKKR